MILSHLSHRRRLRSTRDFTFAVVAFASIAAAQSTEMDRTLVATGDFATPPYQFLDEKGNPSGLEVDLLRAVAESAGWGVTFQPKGPNASLAADLILSEVYTKSPQDGVWRLSTPHTRRSHAIFVREDALYRSLTDLRDRDVLVARKSAVRGWLASHGFEDNLVATASVKDAIALLSAGNYEAVICDRHAGMRAIARDDIENLRRLDEEVYPTDHSFALAREDEELFKALESGLIVLKNTGRDKKLQNKWLAKPVAKNLTLGGIYSYLVWLVIPALIILAAAIVSSYSIRKRMLARLRKLEHELAKARAENEQLSKEQAKQRYVINQLSTVSLVDQLTSVSRN